MARHFLTYSRYFKHLSVYIAELTLLQCILPCIVQRLRKNSALVHCICAYMRYRMMIGLHCMSESRLMRLRQYISDYQNWCMVRYSIVLSEYRTQTNDIIQKVSKKYDKDFDFFKQHTSSHVVADIEQ